ncbi:MAG: hypothetical protein OHK0046_23870 [Anaerolineae bacterium]
MQASLNKIRFVLLLLLLSSFIAANTNAIELAQITLPLTVNFDDDSVLQSWIYDRSVWQIADVEGENVLKGQGLPDKPLIVLGSDDPEWAYPSESDLLIKYNFRLGTASASLRMVFNYVELTGYHVLELTPGRALLKRDDREGDRNYVTERNREIILPRGDAMAPIRENTWHSLVMWISDTRVNVYLDQRLVLRVNDEYTPQVTSGELLFQVNNQLQPVYLDDLQIQRVQPSSTHFEAGNLTRSWSTGGSGTVTYGRDAETGNMYAQLENQLTLTPTIQPLTHLYMSCRLWNDAGGFQLLLTDRDEERLLLDFDQGNLVITRQEANGTALWTTTLSNFYNRSRWDDFHLRLRGTALSIYRDGEPRFNGTIDAEAMQPVSRIRFSTEAGEVQRLDDCLITDLIL